MNRLLAILTDAGAVGTALLAVGFLLWWVAYLRFAAIRDSLLDVNLNAHTASAAANSSSTHANSQSFAYITAVVEQRFVAWKNVLRSMVASAPLLGLLGTVGGMIETFATLHMSGLAHADASVAGGISTALLTTQFGLVLSVPGLMAARALDRFEERHRQMFQRMIDAQSPPYADSSRAEPANEGENA